jgi:DNA invertase Pin-like site-specific DNA recombinase
LVAEQEAEALSNRTIEALAAAKARGVRLDNPRGAEHLAKVATKARARAAAALRTKADARAEELREVIEDIRSEGFTSLEGIARVLNERGIRTERIYKGKASRWHAATVREIYCAGSKQRLREGETLCPTTPQRSRSKTNFQTGSAQRLAML